MYSLPPTARQATEIVRALEPMLRFARELRFVDPYFDAGLAEFREPMLAMLRAAQRRRVPTTVQFQLHTAINSARLNGRPTGANRRPDDIAREIRNDCKTHLGSALQPGVLLKVFVWQENAGDKLHNRYVLSDIGSVCLPAGLDQARRGQAHTDDILLLSREQHVCRWGQYCEGSNAFQSVGNASVIAGE